MLIRNIFFILISVLFLSLIYNKVKNKMFMEKESFFWMVGSILITVLAIFPTILDSIANLLGIEYPPSLLFLVCNLFLAYIIFRQTQQVSMLNEKTKELAQTNALLEEKIKRIIK